MIQENKPISIVINEFLPNPVGSDTEGEWIEIKNLSSQSVSLDSWKICDKSKCFSLNGFEINKNDFLILERNQTKISINNNDEILSLLSPDDKIISKIGFSGKAKEGYSLSRIAKGNWQWTSINTPNKENYYLTPDELENRKESNNQESISLDLESTKDNKVATVKDTKDYFFVNEINQSGSLIGVVFALGIILAGLGIWLIRKINN